MDNNESDKKVLDDNIDEEEISSKKEDTPKPPMFNIEPKRPGCTRDDKTLLLSKKVGFYGIVVFLLLSIIFGAVNYIWDNSLNLLFISLAILAYGVQNIIHLKAIKGCKCPSCSIKEGKLKTTIIVSILISIVILVLFCLAETNVIKWDMR